MKLILLVLIAFSQISFSQNFDKIQKKFTLENCTETDYIIVSRKGNSGIYNKKSQKFEIEPRQSDFYYFEKFQLLYEFTALNKVLIYNLASPDFPIKFVESDHKNKFRVLKGIYHDYTKGDYYYQNGLFGKLDSTTYQLKTISDSLTLVNKSLSEIPDYIQLSFGVERIGDFVLITDLQNDAYNPNPIAVKSISYPDEDSIDIDGNAIYPPNEKGYQQTGVFNLKTRKWALEPAYFVSYSLNNFIFCNKQINYGDETFFPSYGNWDIYKIENNALKLVKSEIKWAKEIPLEKIFDGDSFEFVEADSSYIQFSKNGEMGLYHLSLFYNQDYLNEGEPAYTSIDLKYRLIFNAEYKMIENTPTPSGYDLDRFFLYDNDGVKYVNLDPFANELSYALANTKISIREYGENGNDDIDFTYWIIDDKTYIVENGNLKLFSSIIENPTEKRLLNRRSIEILNDTLVYLEHWIKQGTYWEPVYNHEDYSIALNENGEELYYPPDKGKFKSGIYNLKQNKWHYRKDNAWISMSYDNFQICNPLLDNNGYYTTYTFRIEDHYHNIEEQSNESGGLKMPFIQRLPEYKADTVYTVLGESPSYMGYFEVDNKIGLFYKGYPEIILTPREYAYLKQEYDLYFTINSDSSWLKIGSFDTTFSIKSLNKLAVIPATNLPPAKGDLMLQLESENSHVLLHAEDNKSIKILHFSKEDFEAFYSQEVDVHKWKFSINKLNDSLIYLEDFLADEDESDLTPQPSIVYEWEDSIDASGNIVYYPLTGGYTRSGVYNLNTKKWLISRSYEKIKFSKNQFLLFEGIRDENGLITSHIYRILDIKMHEIWKGEDFSTLPYESPFYQLIFD